MPTTRNSINLIHSLSIIRIAILNQNKPFSNRWKKGIACVQMHGFSLCKRHALSLSTWHIGCSPSLPIATPLSLSLLGRLDALFLSPSLRFYLAFGSYLLRNIVRKSKNCSREAKIENWRGDSLRWPLQKVSKKVFEEHQRVSTKYQIYNYFAKKKNWFGYFMNIYPWSIQEYRYRIRIHKEMDISVSHR